MFHRYTNGMLFPDSLSFSRKLFRLSLPLFYAVLSIPSCFGIVNCPSRTDDIFLGSIDPAQEPGIDHRVNQYNSMPFKL